MRRLVSSLLKSLPKLGPVIVFLVFLFLLFGILGLQLFGTMQYNRCRTTPAPLEDGTWPIDESSERVCRMGSYGFYQCPSGTTCGNPETYGIPLSADNVSQNENINFGITNFDNILAAMLTIFQLITLEGWAPMTYNFQDAMLPFVPAIYFCFLVVLGSFFLLNLILAVIMDSFEQIDSEKRKEKEQKRKRLEESVDSLMSIVRPKFRRKKTMPRSLAFKRKQSLAAITSQGERESQKQNALQTEEQPSFMNSTNTFMMKHSNDISVTRHPNISLAEDIEDLKEIHLAIKERGQMSFSQNVVDNQLHTSGNPLPKTRKRRTDTKLAPNQAAPKSGEHTIQSSMDSEHNFHRDIGVRSNSEENRREVGIKDPIFPLINESGIQQSSNSDNEGLNEAVRQHSNHRSRNHVSFQFSISMYNEKPPSNNSIQNNINHSLNTIHFNPDPEPEPQIDGDTQARKRLSRLGRYSERSMVHPMMDPTTNRHPVPILPHVSSGRTAMSYDSHNQSDSSPSTPHRRKKLGEVIELELPRRRTGESLNHTRDEQLYSDQEIQEQDQDSSEDEEEDFDEMEDEDEEEEENSKTAKQVQLEERGSSLESDSQNDPKEASESDKIPAWSKRNKCHYCTYKLVKLPLFNFFVILAILVNTIVLSLDRYPIPDEQFQALENANLALYCFFLVEMILKLIGLGFKGYTADQFNIFDGVIVIFSSIEIIVSFSFPNSFVEGGALSAFRGFRLLRVFKIARSWTSFQGLLRKIGQTLKDIWSFVILLLIVIFCFAMMGMEFFSFGAFYKYYDNTLMTSSGDTDGIPPRLNFNNLLNSIILIFVVLSGEDWQVIMYDYYRPYGPTAAVYFVCLVVIGNFIFLNLFLAILLKDFQDPENFKVKKKDQKKEEEEELDPQEQEQLKLKNKAQRKSFSAGWRSFTTKIKELITGKKKPKNVKRSGTSQALMTPRSKKKISVNEVRPSHSARLGSLVSAEQTFNSNSPSPPGKTSDLRKLKRGKLGASEQVKEVPEPSQFSIIPVKIAQFKYSSLAGQSEASNGKAMDRSQHEDELFPNRDRATSKDSGQCLVVPSDRKMSDREAKDESKENIKENSVTDIRRPSVQGSWFRKHLSSKSQVRPRKVSKDADQEDGDDDFLALVKDEALEKRILGKSLFMCGPKNKFRLCLAKIVTHKVFEAVIIILIIISSISLAIENPLDDPNGQKAFILEVFDAVMTSFFCLEAAMKIIAFGFILGHKHTYMRNWSNVIDFIIVIFSIVSLAVGNSETKALKAFRLLRVLRPLRVISKNEGLRLGVQSLIMSIPDILNVLVISLLFFLVFGIFSVNYFKGGFFYCQLSDQEVAPGVVLESVESQDLIHDTSINTRQDCLDNGGEWLNRDTNFDNCLNAILLLFEMSTTEGWVDVMYWGIQSRGIEKAPARNNAPFWGLYFICIFVVGSLFIINLFVGVVIRKFEEMKEILGKNFLLTQSQKQWIEMKLLAFRYQPKKRIEQTLPNCRKKLYKITSSNGFEWFIMVCIIINTALMAITWYGMPRSVNDTLDIINYVFAGIFTIEALLKIIALGRNYFCDGWNCFDFIIVCGTLISILIARVSNFDIGTQATLVRSFRIGRIFRLIRRAKSLKMIFDTFIYTIPSLTNVGVILLLLIYIYAILGVNMFATVKLQDELNEYANFQSFGTAFLVLMRVSTGEAWNSIMHDTVRSKSAQFDCVQNPSYAEIQAYGEPNGCGNGFGYFYFCSFVVIVSFVYLNLFIAIILQGFSDTNERANLQINQQVYQDFRNLWSEYDKEGKGLIPVRKLPEMVNKLTFPLGVPDEIKKDRILIGEWIGNLRIKSYQNFKYFHFWDVLQALIRETIIREKVKEAVIAEGEKRPEGEKQTYIIDEEKVSSELQQQLVILEENASKSNEARKWRSMIKTQRRINKRLHRYKPDNYGSQFIWAAKLIADFLRRRILVRKMVGTYAKLRGIDQESSHGENIGSISFQEVEFTNMVRNVSDNSLANNDATQQSVTRSVYSIPVHPVTPLSSEARKLPRFNESWDSEHRPSLNLSGSPSLSQHNISTSAIRLLRAAHDSSIQAQRPQSPQEKEKHRQFAQRFQFSPYHSNQSPVSPKFGVQSMPHKMTFGNNPRDTPELPDFSESLIHAQSPDMRFNQETPPPMHSDERGGDLSQDHRPSFLISELEKREEELKEELKTEEDQNPHNLSAIPADIGHVSFGDDDENVLETQQGMDEKEKLQMNDNILAHNNRRNNAFNEPQALAQQESLPPSIHDSTLDDSKQSR